MSCYFKGRFIPSSFPFHFLAFFLFSPAPAHLAGDIRLISVPSSLPSIRTRRSQTTQRKQFNVMPNQTTLSFRHTCKLQSHNFPALNGQFYNNLSCFRFHRTPFISYGITNLAYRSLQDQNESQCICILGENGSGKTETARIILHFLSNVHSDQTLRSRKIFHNQGSSRLQRCKSLVSYPKYEPHEDAHCRPEKRSAIKYARKSHVSAQAHSQS